jgi:hypothetical protein
MKQNSLILCVSAIFLGSLANCNRQTPAIDITAPAAGAKLLAGDTITVQWNPSVSKPVLSYNYHLINPTWQPFDTILSLGPEEAKVVLPTTWYSDSFQIRVEDGSGAATTGTSAYLPEKYIYVTAPTAGQKVHAGDTVTINWRDNPALFSSLLVNLSIDSGKSYTNLNTAGSIPPTTTSFVWVVGAGSVGTYCEVQVCEYNGNNPFSTSGFFQILAR